MRLKRWLYFSPASLKCVEICIETAVRDQLQTMPFLATGPLNAENTILRFEYSSRIFNIEGREGREKVKIGCICNSAKASE